MRANDGPGAPDYTHGMGYSYSDDPNFMYCAEDMENMDAANWWLPSCDLSGGSSGGGWFQPFDEAEWRRPADFRELLGLHDKSGHGRAETEWHLGRVPAQCRKNRLIHVGSGRW